MKYVLPFTVLATPALAHSGAHAHPHGIESWMLLLLCIAGAAVTLWVRR